MTIDYKALAERLKEHAALHDSLAAHSDEQRVWADDLRTLEAMVRGMAKQESVRAVPFDVADRALCHVGMANYAERQQEAEGWLQNAEFEAFTHPAPQPHPIDPHMIVAEDRFPDELEPTEAQIEAAADVVLAWESETFGKASARVFADAVLRAALAAEQPEPTEDDDTDRTIEEIADFFNEHGAEANEPTDAQIDPYYKLVGRNVVPVLSAAEAFNFDRRVALTEIKGVRISTVFLGVNHAWNDGPPILFETMVFGGPLSDEQDRCSTYDEAEAMHERMCKRVRRAIAEDDAEARG